MKVLFLTQYYDPEPFIIHDKARAIVEEGHSVTVVTGVPNYPDGKIYKGYKTGNYKEDDVEIIRVNLRPRKSGAKNLFLNYLSFVKEANKIIKGLDDSFDVVYVYQLSPVIMAIPGIKYKKKHKVPLILYCLDLWPASLISGGIKKGSLPYLAFKIISKKIYKKADSIHISSRQFENYFKNELNINGNFIYNPQYSGDQTIISYQKDPLFNVDKINITFTGNVGEMQSLDTIIKAMSTINKNVIFNIVGDGSKLKDLKLLTQQLKLQDRVLFHGRKPAEMMGSYMQQSDALVVSMKKDEVISYTLPAKVQSYLQSGKFILGSIDGEAANVISQSGAGKVSNAEDIEGFANLVNYFIENIDECKQSGLSGPKYYNDHFGKDKFIKILSEDMRRITK